jgi:hypothetical protein
MSAQCAGAGFALAGTAANVPKLMTTAIAAISRPVVDF